MNEQLTVEEFATIANDAFETITSLAASVADRDVATDAFQDVMVKFLETGRYKTLSRDVVVPLLVKMTKDRARDIRRRRQREVTFNPRKHGTAYDWSEAERLAHLPRVAKDNLKQLEPVEREVAELLILGYTSKEISERRNVSIAVTYATIKRAIARLGGDV